MKPRAIAKSFVEPNDDLKRRPLRGSRLLLNDINVSRRKVMQSCHLATLASVFQQLTDPRKKSGERLRHLAEELHFRPKPILQILGLPIVKNDIALIALPLH